MTRFDIFLKEHIDKFAWVIRDMLDSEIFISNMKCLKNYRLDKRN